MKILELTGNSSSSYGIKSEAAIVMIATMALLMATAIALTGFPRITPVLATPLTDGTTEQFGNDTAAADATTITLPPANVGQEQQKQPISIIKDSTNSYIISGGSSSVGSFDTTYRIAGESSAVTAAEDLIISTITSDYGSSSTIGYVTAGNTTTTSASVAGASTSSAVPPTLPDPFATPEQISEKITSELRRVIDETDGNNTDNNMTTLQEGGQQQPMMEIKCVFGMELDDMRCDNYIPSARAIDDVALGACSAPPEISSVPLPECTEEEEEISDDNAGTADVPE
jgi:hypothetical protein